MIGPMIIDKAKSLYDEIKITDKGTFSAGSNKTLKNLINYRYCLIKLEYLIIWHLSGPVNAILKEFYFTL
jgi:hypothetical protein